ncbi:MAG: 3-isopropylmalate dehydratase small subunit [Thermoanaerobaculia bacterium]
MLTIVASDVARIFLQNSINLGLTIVTAPGVEASVGDEVVVEEEKVVNRMTGKSWDVVPLPPARQAIIDAGGLIAYTGKKMLEMQAKG